MKNFVLAVLLLLFAGVVSAQSPTTQNIFSITKGPVDSSFSNSVAAAAPVGTDKITISCSEDYYNGDALFSTTIDGAVVAASTPCTSRNNPAGTISTSPQVIQFSGSWGTAVQHKIIITFLNDSFGGSANSDRNLFIQAVSYDGLVLSAPTLSGTYASACCNNNGGARLGGTGNKATWTTGVITIPPPALTTISPNTIYINTGQPTTIVLTGSGFTTSQQVMTDLSNPPIAIPSKLLSDTSISATFPSVNTAGTQQIWVADVGGNTEKFTITKIAAPLPNPPTNATITLGPLGITLVCNSAGSYTIGPLSLACSAPGVVHDATLTWTATTTCIQGSTNGTSTIPCTPAGYHIYRGSTTGGPYGMLGSSSVTSYVDLTVAAGGKYFYVVTAYMAQSCNIGQTTPCGESGYSNEATGTIPTP